MPEFKPTPSQEAAVRTRGADILVSAGAGSGKTMVLTERLMAYLTDPHAPEELDRFLVITFTKAAAGELKSRIADKIADALAADPGSRRLRRQSALCRQAQIGTIHSFCAALLRENAHLLQLSPDFRILDEDRAAAMRAAALERELEASYERAEDYPGFLLLADTVGAGRDDRRLAELALTLHAKMQSHARPERWAARQTELLRADYADARETPWGREVLESAAATAAYWAEEFERLLGGIRGAERIKTAHGPSLQETAEALRELCRCLELGWDRARACFPVPFPGLRGVPKDLEPALTERVKARRAACKKAMDKLADALASESAALLDELRQTAPAMEALLALTLRFDARYAADKRRAGLVDYADLEHLSARLLIGEDGEPTELARRVSGRYREIMVDEYQDVSRVQDEIFRALGSGGASRFFVGDVKQSIYRFRLAEPEIFNEKYRDWPDPELAEPGAPRRVLLQENFRSRREILGAANSVFSRCMSRRLGDLDYDENAMLRYGAVYYDEKAPGPAAKPELCLVALPGKDEEGESPDKTALEAAFVARQIRELVRRDAERAADLLRRRVFFGEARQELRQRDLDAAAFALPVDGNRPERGLQPDRRLRHAAGLHQYGHGPDRGVRAHLHLVQRHEIPRLHVAVIVGRLHQERRLLAEAERHRLHFFRGQRVRVQGDRAGIAAARLFFKNYGMDHLMHKDTSCHCSASYSVTFRIVSPSIWTAQGRENFTWTLRPVRTVVMFVSSTCFPSKIFGKLIMVFRREGQQKTMTDSWPEKRS